MASSSWALGSSLSLLKPPTASDQIWCGRNASLHHHHHHHHHHSTLVIRAGSSSRGGISDRGDVKGISGAVTAAAAAILLSFSGAMDGCSVGMGMGMGMGMAMAAEKAEPGFYEYYGTAASASSYGGFGGNASKKDTAEYVYDVPDGWKERLISKVEKGTNGTDSEFFNPRRRAEKVYLTFLSGFSRLSGRDTVLGNLALSDVNLQDMISSAEDIRAAERTDPASGQLYYDFEIDSPVAHSLISVTCANNKLYAHFVNSPPANWAADAPVLRHIHDSFTTAVGPRRD